MSYKFFFNVNDTQAIKDSSILCDVSNQLSNNEFQINENTFISNLINNVIQNLYELAVEFKDKGEKIFENFKHEQYEILEEMKVQELLKNITEIVIKLFSISSDERITNFNNVNNLVNKSEIEKEFEDEDIKNEASFFLSGNDNSNFNNNPDIDLGKKLFLFKY